MTEHPTMTLTQAHILIVDDEPSNLKLMEKMLQTQHYTNLTLVQDPRLVMDVYQEQRPHLILLDINMPHMDGFAVMRALREMGDPMLPPIIVLTAQFSRDFHLRSLAEGARDFIGKPFDRAEMLMRVKNQLEVHYAHLLLHDQKQILEDMVRVRTEELHRTRLQVVQRLGRAAEYRDNETGYHILRMSKSSEILARSMGWNDYDSDLMLHASPMHDIGKIGIPDAVLQKPGRFEPVEWELMKTHAEIGAQLLDGDNSDLMHLARTIALTHHEKWDGSGYPKGLVGDAIPHAGRIVAIADVFDALTSVRPYKKAWPVEEAVAFVEENAGKHFDPEVVVHFKLCLPQILEVRERYAEPKGGKDGCNDASTAS